MKLITSNFNFKAKDLKGKKADDLQSKTLQSSQKSLSLGKLDESKNDNDKEEKLTKAQMN